MNFQLKPNDGTKEKARPVAGKQNMTNSLIRNI